MIRLLILGLWLPVFVWADAISTDQFFSSDLLKGGVTCASLGVDAYLNDPAPAYEKPSPSSRFPEKKMIARACVKGGGDCDCYVMYTEVVSASASNQAFYKAKTSDGRTAWVLADGHSQRSIETLAVDAKKGRLEFRNPAPEIFLTPDLAKKISAAALVEVPFDVLKRARPKNTQRVVGATFRAFDTIKGRRFAKFDIEWVTNDPDSDDWNDDATAKKSEQRFKLRSAWVPLFDSAGRITFWLSEEPGC